MDRSVARFKRGSSGDREGSCCPREDLNGWHIRGRPYSNVCHFQGQSRPAKDRELIRSRTSLDAAIVSSVLFRAHRRRASDPGRWSGLARNRSRKRMKIKSEFLVWIATLAVYALLAGSQPSRAGIIYVSNYANHSIQKYDLITGADLRCFLT